MAALKDMTPEDLVRVLQEPLKVSRETVATLEDEIARLQAKERGTIKVCPECGSDQVEELLAVWSPANAYEVRPRGEVSLVEIYWCPACETHPHQLEERKHDDTADSQ